MLYLFKSHFRPPKPFSVQHSQNPNKHESDYRCIFSLVRTHKHTQLVTFRTALSWRILIFCLIETEFESHVKVLTLFQCQTCQDQVNCQPGCYSSSQGILRVQIRHRPIDWDQHFWCSWDTSFSFLDGLNYSGIFPLVNNSGQFAFQVFNAFLHTLKSSNLLLIFTKVPVILQ